MKTPTKTMLAVGLLAALAWTMRPHRREPGAEQWMAARRAARDSAATHDPNRQETK